MGVKKRLFLLSDFSLSEPYLAAVKARVLAVNSDLHLIDLSHQILPGDIEQGSFFLWQILTVLQKGDLVFAVVDPGVGSSQQSLLVETERALWVGPDNGLLWTACMEDGIKNIYSIDRDFFNCSMTFHGRDVYAPVIADNHPISQRKYLRESQFKIDLDLFQIEKTDHYLKGQVLHIDTFGNVITNIKAEYLGNFERIAFKNMRYSKLHHFYAQVPKGCPLALINSHGLLELALHGVNFAHKVKAKKSDSIEVYLP